MFVCCLLPGRDDDVGVSADRHLLKVVDPRGVDAFALLNLKHVSVLRILLHVAPRLNLLRVVVQLVDKRPSRLLVLVHGGRLALLGHAALGLEVVVELVQEGPRRSQILEAGLELGLVVAEGSLGAEAVGRPGHDVLTRGRQRQVLQLGLRLGEQRVGREAESRWAAIIRTRFTRLAKTRKKFFLFESFEEIANDAKKEFR